MNFINSATGFKNSAMNFIHPFAGSKNRVAGAGVVPVGWLVDAVMALVCFIFILFFNSYLFSIHPDP
jgi:hypothetical protein